MRVRINPESDWLPAYTRYVNWRQCCETADHTKPSHHLTLGTFPATVLVVPVAYWAVAAIAAFRPTIIPLGFTSKEQP